MNAKTLTIDVLDLSGIARLLKPFYAGRGIILAMHRVVETREATLIPGNAVTMQQLRTVVRLVRKEGWEIVPLDELPYALDRPRRFVCITFDDGYADNLTAALPVLELEGVPFSVFPSLGFINRTVLPHWLLAEWLLLAERAPQTIPDPEGRPFFVRTATYTDRCRSCERLAAYARRPEWKKLLIELCAAAGISLERLMDQTFLSWTQLRTLSKHPLASIGSHAVTHTRLTQLSAAQVRDELRSSRARLSDAIGTRVSHVAYPYGSAYDCGQREFAIAREAGFTMGLTTRQGNLFRSHLNRLHALPRVTLSMVPHAAKPGFVRTSLFGARNALLNRGRRFAGA